MNKDILNVGKNTRWKKGQSGNPKGRPRKIALTLKHQGYNGYEIRDTIDKMLAMTKDELSDFIKRDDITILEMGAARMMHDYIKKGKENILEYVLPKKQIRESTMHINEKVTFSKNDLIKELEKRNLPTKIFD